MRPTRQLDLPAAFASSLLQRLLLLGVLVLLVAGLAGCGALEDSRTTPPVQTAPLSGTWDVTSRFEVPATVAAPGPLGDVLRLVHGLNVDPGAALLDLAEQAGVPALAELRLVLPDALESELTGWMNGYLATATAGGVSPHDRIADLDALIRSVLLSWELRSTLSLPAGAPGTHAPLALAFDSPAGPVVVPLDATAPVTAGVDVTATLSWPDGLSAPATAEISDHAMGVPFGRFALAGLDAILAQQGFADLRAALSGAVACPALAADVADHCVGPVCVGHQASLLAICQAGVDEAAARLEAQVLGLDYQAIHFQAGTATAPASGVGSLTAGTWTAAIDLGSGPEQATLATFTAARPE
jgi:hypothetical protein